MTRKLNLFLLILIVFAGLPFVWLLLDTSSSGVAVKPVSIGELRRLAESMPGKPPESVRYELIARRRIVSNLLAAGSGLRPVPYVIRAYELVFPDRQFITVDRGMSRALAEEHGFSDFDPKAQAIVNRLVTSSRIGLTLSIDVEHSGRREAVADSGSGRDEGSAETRSAPYTVARGIVVLPADDVAPGRRMVYVRLASGRELLLAGDIAPVHTSWQELRPPARLVTSFFVDEDREEIATWLRTLSKLKDNAPGLEIVSGHGSLVPRGLIRGFTNDPRLDRFARDKRLALHGRMR